MRECSAVDTNALLEGQQRYISNHPREHTVSWSCLPIADFAAVADRWDALNDATGGIPFLRAAFLKPLLKHYGNGNEVIAVYMRSDDLLGAAILGRKGLARWQAFMPSQLPLGALLHRQGVEFVSHWSTLFSAMPGVAGMIELPQLDPLMIARPSDGAAVATLDYVKTAWVDVDGLFENFWAARGKNLRDNVKKLHKKLVNDAIVPVLELVTDAREIPAAVLEYSKLETAGWKNAIGTAIAPNTVQGNFYIEAMQSMAQIGQARIYRYRFNDTIVAMDLCIEHGDIMVVLKTAYDEAHSRLSPATLMREQIFRQIFEEGRLRRVEFYGPLMEWHERWTANSRVLYHVNLYRGSSARSAANMIKRFLHRDPRN